MSDRDSLRNTIVGTVIGSLVVAAALALWPAARTAMAAAGCWLWNALASNYPVRGWVLVLLVIPGLMVLVQLVRAIIASRAPPYEKEYTEDALHGVRWRWTWQHGSPASVWCFCPTCDAELVYQEFRHVDWPPLSPGETSEPDHTLLICERCHEPKARVPGLKGYAVSSVEREIVRRVRTGEWQRGPLNVASRNK